VIAEEGGIDDGISLWAGVLDDDVARNFCTSMALLAV
jgi:hypothetical protein